MTVLISPSSVAEGEQKAFSCDRCRALPKVRGVLPSGGEVLFCGHHAREYAALLRDQCVDTVVLDVSPDEARQLQADLQVSASASAPSGG